MGQSPRTSEQQLQKKEAPKDRGSEGSFDAHAGRWGSSCRWGSSGRWGNGLRDRTLNRLENELSNCYIPFGQELTSSVVDIGTALQLLCASAVCMLSNDVDTLFSFVTLLECLVTGALVLGMARLALPFGGVLCCRFIDGAIALLSLAALAYKMVCLVIK